MCFKSLLISLLLASGDFLSEFLLLGISLRLVAALYLYSLGNLTGSSTAAVLALGITGIHKPLHYGKVEIPLEEN